MSNDQAEKEKARRAIALLNLMMVVFIAGPVIIYLLVK